MERRRTPTVGPKSATVYLIEKEALPVGGTKTVLNPVTVKLGISDGSSTQVIEGLHDGDVVVTGLVPNATADSAQGPRNPFSPFGRRRPR